MMWSVVKSFVVPHISQYGWACLTSRDNFCHADPYPLCVDEGLLLSLIRLHDAHRVDRVSVWQSTHGRLIIMICADVGTG